MFGIDDLLLGGLAIGGTALAQEEQRKKQARQAAQGAFSMTPRIAQPAPSQPQASSLPSMQAPQIQHPDPAMGTGPYEGYQPPAPVSTGEGSAYRDTSEPVPENNGAGYQETKEQTPEMAAQAADSGGVPLYLRALVAGGALGGLALAGSSGRGEVIRGESPGGMRELPGGGSPQQFGANHRATQNYLDYYRRRMAPGGQGYGF